MKRQKVRARIGALAGGSTALFGMFAVLAYLDLLLGYEPDLFLLRWLPAIAGVLYFIYWWADKPDRESDRSRREEDRAQLEDFRRAQRVRDLRTYKIE
jgi:hypothetical protein